MRFLVRDFQEEARLDALTQLKLLDSPPSESFDRITRMASQIFGLPVAAVSGTLSTRFASQSGAGIVRAKTGTLNKASALAGYVVSKSGQVLTFALISNEASLLPARAAADKAASALADI